MAGAVGYALAAPTLVTLIVFMALGIGFALPFLLIAYVPGLLAKLPKPGPWMVRFKEVLSFPMFAAAIWLVDFTAAWCVTCKVNEIRVLKTKRTQALFEETNTAFLVADWTNKNDEIAAELAKYGRAGVPLYLVYSNNSVSPAILPQILTYNDIRKALGTE